MLRRSYLIFNIVKLFLNRTEQYIKKATFHAFQTSTHITVPSDLLVPRLKPYPADVIWPSFSRQPARTIIAFCSSTSESSAEEKKPGQLPVLTTTAHPSLCTRTEYTQHQGSTLRYSRARALHSSFFLQTVRKSWLVSASSRRDPTHFCLFLFRNR